jgi:chaperonin GroEL
MDTSDRKLSVIIYYARFSCRFSELIATAFAKVGKKSYRTVEEAKGTDTYVDVVEGMQFDRGYIFLHILD